MYVAEDQHLRGKLWVIKQMQPIGVDGNERNRLLTQFQAEAMLLSQIEHPCLPKLVDFFAQDSSLFVIREFVPGTDLKSVLDQRGPFPEDEALKIAMQLADLMAFLLKKKLAPIVLRDMSLPNLIHGPDGKVMLVDLGFSRLFQRETRTGPPDYAAPEQFTGEGNYDARTLVYNLGALLYHLVTGTNPGSSPFNLVPVSHLNPRISEATRNLIEKCTKNEAKERPGNFGELKKSLESALNRSHKSPRPEAPPQAAPAPKAPKPPKLPKMPKAGKRTGTLVVAGGATQGSSDVSPRLKAWLLGFLLTVLMGGGLFAIYYYLLRPHAPG